ncbi:Retrovirus-related Pol poly from transposon, partial, partial [Paramuricea clavata]
MGEIGGEEVSIRDGDSARPGMVIPAKVSASDKKARVNFSGIVEPNLKFQRPPDLALERSVVQPQVNRILVRVVNTSPTPITLYKHSKVATMYHLRENGENGEIFEMIETVIVNEINTGDHSPLRQHARRIPGHRREEVDAMLETMSDKGVIRKSSSPWAATIVLVGKKDGSTMFCVDYRKLNDVTKKDACPLPRIDDTLDALSGATFFSTLDLASGYWQVELDSNDREKSAFTMHQGLYEFNVMPFGLRNAPSTLQRLMEDFGEHTARLREVLVFLRLQNAGLKLKPKKCKLFAERSGVPRHIISEN